MDAVNNGGKTRFQPGNSGRPKGSRNKLSTQQLREARELFLPSAVIAAQIVQRHLARDLKALKGNKDLTDSATTRHFATLALEYAHGKPPQRYEVEVYDARVEAERMADDMGLEGDDRKRAVEETVRLLAEARE